MARAGRAQPLPAFGERPGGAFGPGPTVGAADSSKKFPGPPRPNSAMPPSRRGPAPDAPGSSKDKPEPAPQAEAPAEAPPKEPPARAASTEPEEPRWFLGFDCATKTFAWSLSRLDLPALRKIGFTASGIGKPA